jgi:hypothetical protein
MRRIGKNGFEFMEAGEDVVVFNVPIFCEHPNTKPGLQKSFQSEGIGPDELKSIYKASLEREESGAALTLTIAHPDEETSEPEIIGSARNLSLGSIKLDGRDVGCIYADYVIDKTIYDTFVATGKLPRRSVDLSGDNALSSGRPYIYNVSLLGTTPPFLPLPDMGKFTARHPGIEFQAVAEKITVPFGTEQEKNMALTAEMLAEFKSVVTAAVKPLAEKVERLAAATKLESDDDKDDDKLEAECPDCGKPESECKCDKKMAAGETVQMAAKVKAVENANAKLSRELDAMRAKVTLTTYQGKLEEMRADHYQFDADKELAHLMSLTTDEARDSEIERMRANYRQIPVHKRLDRSAMFVPPDASMPLEGSTKTEFEADKRAREIMAASNGKTPYHAAFNAALEEVKNNGAYA